MPKKCLSSATKRTHNYSVHLSDIELDWLRIKAKDAGMPASELIRRLTLGKPLPKRLSKISLATYQELGRIGNNLNQLTKATNTAIKVGYSPPVDPKLLEELLDLLHQCRRQLACVDVLDDFESEEPEDDWEAEEG
ncbi:plasmid mobilization protein [Iningainema tapete]|uniref:Plasmid mobilization relaxosome protein MobC n=1 Tax=Iningainema tapete BLCC-T55 TaxID=2748662 RepID=A0A8J6XEW0_9CYAN|nr:plasmid mobilization relaxosome protein MobC [Iningainema tapete]MBD2774309.1 plasmid mobilization relaxosome protein MobC [Iningainema tapete BLCC-T55]